jgi:hypothetical protein
LHVLGNKTEEFGCCVNEERKKERKKEERHKGKYDDDPITYAYEERRTRKKI